jgi:hypothetical protein
VHDPDTNAQRFAALAALRLERSDVVPVETDLVPGAGRTVPTGAPA